MKKAKGVDSSRPLASKPRPMGIAKTNLRAVVRVAEVLPLLNELELDDDSRLTLAGQIRTIMSEFLGPLIGAERLPDHATSLKKLAQIPKKADLLVGLLESIHPDFLVELDRARSSSANLRLESERFFEFPHLIAELRDLSQVAVELQTTVMSRSVGRPFNDALRKTVERLVHEIRAGTGNPVRTSRSEGSVSRRHFVGPEGGLIRELFKCFLPFVSEGALVRIVEETKAKQRRPSQSSKLPGNSRDQT